MKNKLLCIVVSILFFSCQNDINDVSEQELLQSKQDKKELTLILDEGDLTQNLLKNVTSSQLEFHKGAGLPNFSDFEYIVATPSSLAPKGFLRKITAIKDNSGSVILRTVPVQINELIGNAELSEVSYFVPNDPESYKNLRTKDGKKVSYTVRTSEWEYDFAEFSMDLDETWDADNDPSTTYDQVRVNGNLTVQPSLLVEVDIKWFKLKEFKSVINASTSTDLTLDWRSNFPIDFTHEVANIDLPATTFKLGWLPVVINHNLVVLLDVNGNVNARVTSSFAGSLDTETGVRYTADADEWSFINKVENFEMDFVPYDANASFNLNARLSERFESTMFEVARVGVRSTQDLFAQANLSGTYGTPSVLSWNADTNITVGAFAELEFLDIPDVQNSWDEDIWSTDFRIGQGTIIFE